MKSVKSLTSEMGWHIKRVGGEGVGGGDCGERRPSGNGKLDYVTIPSDLIFLIQLVASDRASGLDIVQMLPWKITHTPMVSSIITIFPTSQFTLGLGHPPQTPSTFFFFFFLFFLSFWYIIEN